ncbi:helix-turn-helix domain-containing protein [Candidatus Dojkabacteria bacterium]|jgi:hypothetical protein|nr:helix-turn-helix domain-containing protein [Candidatus Dojkabacteria bacterium]
MSTYIMSKRDEAIKLRLSGKKYSEIAEILHFSRQRAHQLINNIHSKPNYDNIRNKRIKYRKVLIEELGGKCNRCGFSDLRALQIDHINGGGSKEITKYYKKMIKEAPGKYQILCANCNWIKRVENNEVRPRKIY